MELTLGMVGPVTAVPSTDGELPVRAEGASANAELQPSAPILPPLLPDAVARPRLGPLDGSPGEEVEDLVPSSLVVGGACQRGRGLKTATCPTFGCTTTPVAPLSWAPRDGKLRSNAAFCILLVRLPLLAGSTVGRPPSSPGTIFFSPFSTARAVELMD